MAEPIKIPEEDLKKIEEIQQQYQQRIADFGQLYLEKMGVDEAIKAIAAREDQLQNDWKSLRKAESDFIDDLLKRYGEGNINLKQGLFIPST